MFSLINQLLSEVKFNEWENKKLVTEMKDMPQIYIRMIAIPQLCQLGS